MSHDWLRGYVSVKIQAVSLGAVEVPQDALGLVLVLLRALRHVPAEVVDRGSDVLTSASREVEKLSYERWERE